MRQVRRALCAATFVVAQVLGVTPVLAQESSPPAAPQAAPPAHTVHYSNKWRMQVSGGADNTGLMTFRLTPKDGTPVEIPVTLKKGRSEDGCARDIRDAFKSVLDKKTYKVEVDDGEDVLVKKHHEPDFTIELAGSTVKGTHVRFDRE
jgi:hypothetical protein